MKIYKIMLVVLLLISLYPGCEKEEEKAELSLESTSYISLSSINKITGVTAEVEGEVTLPNSFSAESQGVCWSVNPNPIIKDDHTNETTGAPGYKSQLTGLNINTTYYVRAFVKCAGKIYYSEQQSFTTKKIVLVNVSKESNWNYWIVGMKGESFFIKTENYIPSTIYYKPSLEQEGFTIIADNYGRPAQIVTNGNLILLNNFHNQSVDVTVITSRNEFKIFKGLQSPFGWSSLKITPVLKSLPLNDIKSLASGITNLIDLLKVIQSRGTEMISSFPDKTELGQILLSAAPEDLQEIIPSPATIRICNQLAGCAAMSDINCFSNLAKKAESFAATAKGIINNNKEAANLAALQLADPTLVMDIDGNVYHTIIIGNQIWMQENLRVTHYRNGDPVLQHISDSEWMMVQTGALSFYKEDLQHQISFGALYNWYAVNDSRKIAPSGWHIPSVEEYYTLINFLGANAGSKLKEQNTIHWNAPNLGATNESKFSALPGGFRGDVCRYLGLYGWWYSSSTQDNASVGLALTYDNPNAGIFRDPRLFMGYSVRCLKD
jgi:uncharacterized protein (TIGR02145 family)